MNGSHTNVRPMATPAGIGHISRRRVLGLAGAAGLAIPMTTALPAVAAPAPQGSDGELVFVDGFDFPTANSWSETSVNNSFVPLASGTTWPEVSAQTKGAIELVDDPDQHRRGMPRGRKPVASVARFAVPNDGRSYRSELTSLQFAYGRYRYTVSHFIPTDWAPWKYESILAQWHGYRLANGQNTNPPIALSITGDPTPVWELELFQLTSPTTNERTTYLLETDVLYGQWNDWVFDITWSTPASAGLLVVTHNGTEVFRVTGINNYHQDTPPYFQTGIYRASWDPKYTYPNGGRDVVVYHKGVTVRKLGAS